MGWAEGRVAGVNGGLVRGTVVDVLNFVALIENKEMVVLLNIDTGNVRRPLLPLRPSNTPDTGTSLHVTTWTQPVFQLQMPPVPIPPARIVLECTSFLRAHQLLDILPTVPSCLLMTSQILGD